MLLQGQAKNQATAQQLLSKYEDLKREEGALLAHLARLADRPEKHEVIAESVSLIGERLHEFMKGFKKAKGAMKKRLLKRVLKQVLVSPKGLHIFMLLADQVDIPQHQIQLVEERDSKNAENVNYALTKRASGDDSKLSVLSSDIGKNGEPSFLLAESLYPIDYTPFTFKSRYRISAEDTKIIVEKYQKGCSLRDIATLLGCSKGKIRNQLRKSGHEPRDFSAKAARNAWLKRGKTNARPYFGFCYLDGEVVKDPREFPTLQFIHRYWSQGKSAHYIRLELDNVKARSRLGKAWSWLAIQNILERFENKNIVLSKGGKYELR